MKRLSREGALPVRTARAAAARVLHYVCVCLSLSELLGPQLLSWWLFTLQSPPKYPHTLKFNPKF